MKPKILEWVRRYLPAEFFAIITTLIGGSFADFIFHNSIITAIVATWSENVGYYGQIFYADLRARLKKDKKLSLSGVLKVFRNIAFEFGLAEYLDSFLIRPISQYLWPKITGNLTLGLILGKLSADMIFYFPTIIFYELRKRYLRD